MVGIAQPSPKNRRLNKDRSDVFSIPNYVIKKGISPGARHGPTERQRIHHKAHNTLRKAKKKGHKTILERFLNSPHYRESQTKIRRDENIHAAPRRDRTRGPFLRCDKMGTKQKRKLVEARAELWSCKWTRGSTRWLEGSKESLWQAVQRICSNSRIC